MKEQRTLSVVNLVGCLLLGGILIVQWVRNDNLQKERDSARVDKAAVEGQRDAALGDIGVMQKDIGLLKESIESLSKESAAMQAEIGGKQDESAKLTADLEVARKGLDEWKLAVEERDKRIAELETNLKATRERLDQAIERLKKAAQQ